MSKMLFVITFLLVYLFSPFFLVNVQAAASISFIGDLPIGNPKGTTVSGLTPGNKYYWAESKVTSTIPTNGYTTFFIDCYDANSNGEITNNLGPYSTPGLYRLEISKVSTSGTCRSLGNPLTSQDFSVGGPTGDSCCDIGITSRAATYDRSKDVCTAKLIPDLFPTVVQSNIQKPTVCSTKGTFCEPDSLQCFTTKTFVVGGKICKDLKDSTFDPDKNVVCGGVGGIAQQCGTATDPAIRTAIGCIHTSVTGFTKDFLKFAVGISGGLAFLMMLLGAFQMLTSAGNPETLNAGRDRFTSAIVGLLMVIFAVLLLKILGFDILGLPGLG